MQNEVKLEDLILVDRCGAGLFKNVYEVEDRITMNRYALKTVSRSKIKRYNIQ